MIKRGGGGGCVCFCVCVRGGRELLWAGARGQEHERQREREREKRKGNGNDPARLASLLCLVLGVPWSACDLFQEAHPRFTHGANGTKRYYIV